MPQHVRMYRELHLGPSPDRPNSAWKALGVIGPSRSGVEWCEFSARFDFLSSRACLR